MLLLNGVGDEIDAINSEVAKLVTLVMKALGHLLFLDAAARKGDVEMELSKELEKPLSRISASVKWELAGVKVEIVSL